MGTSSNIAIGPGTIYVAPLGSTEPTSASITLDAAWVSVGYTEEGSTFSFETTTQDIKVAEEFYPVAVRTTGVSAMVAFQMAEATQKNLALALNAGTAAGTGASLEPVTPGSEIRIMILVAKENGARWIFRRCFQSGSVEIANKNSPNKTIIGVEFKLEKPDGAEPWKVYKSLTPVSGLI
jgi:hypothetical protein